MKILLCSVEEIPEEGTKRVAFFEREVIVLKVAGQLKVYLNLCPHLGGSFRREDNKLICQSHEAEFDCRSGQCLGGPAHPQSRLLRIPVYVEDGLLTYAADFDPPGTLTFAQIFPHLIRQNLDPEYTPH